MVKIAPSLMCADLLNLGQQLKVLDSFESYWYHIDVMDGQYVPNFAFGPDFVRTVRSATTTPIIVHMMCKSPENHIKLFAEAGADCLAIHVESTDSPIRAMQYIKSLGMKAGIALNPATSVDCIHYLKDYVDFITLMSFEPGFAGLKFIDFTYDKIRKIREILGPERKDVLIEIDGGINSENGMKSLKAGADILVAGYFSVFKKDKPLGENYLEFINSLTMKGSLVV